MRRRLALLVALFALLWIVAREQPVTIQQQPPIRGYRLFIPFVNRSPYHLGMGIAGGHADLLKADWFYNYGWCDSPCVPAILAYADIVPHCPTRMILWNEPESPPPYGHPILPTLAAERSQQIRQQCPNTLLIAGNTVQGTLWWTDEYLANGGQADLLGVHCYSYALAQSCIDIIETFKAHFQHPICLTEWNILLDTWATTEFPKYLDYIKLLGCSAVFSDRQWMYPWGTSIDISLVDYKGVFTERGKLFAERNTIP